MSQAITTASKPVIEVESCRLTMSARVEVRVGDRLHLPYRIEWVAGEPSPWIEFCKKYMQKDCTLKKILVQEVEIAGSKFRNVRFLVKFDDGMERDIDSSSLHIWNPRGALTEPLWKILYYKFRRLWSS